MPRIHETIDPWDPYNTNLGIMYKMTKKYMYVTWQKI